MNRRGLLPALILTLLLGPSAPAPCALTGVTQRVTVTSSGEPATSYPPEVSAVAEGSIISADGRFVVFASHATDLVPGDTNGCRDAFLRDRVTNTTLRVSLSSTGEQANGSSFHTDISADGRYVLFGCRATNLVPGDTNGRSDVFVRDRLLGTTERVNVSSAGQQANDGGLRGVAISADGRYVAFWDDATNLVPGDTNGCYDVFVRDRVAGTTERVNVSSSGEQASVDASWASVSISADGRYVAFSSSASNLVPGGRWMQVYVRDRTAGTTELVSVNMDGGTSASSGSSGARISADGRYVVFTSWASDLVPGDTNDWGDAFLRDRLLATTERLSVTSTGEQGTVADPPGFRWTPGGISADGRYVVFESPVMGLVPGGEPHHYNVYIRDRVAGTTEYLVVNMSGEASYGNCPTITPDGRCIAFRSSAPDLVPGDTDFYSDIFVRDLDARFHDVASCFWAFPHIEACVNAEIVYGYGDNTYQPKYDVSRAQMAVYISRALAGGDDNVPDGPAEATFDDVPTDHWACKYIEYCVANDIVQGFDPVTYGPTVEVSRDAMAAFISRAVAGGDDNVPDGPAEATFDDVPTDHWAFKYVEYCSAEEIVQGYDPVTYGPTITVSRDQMAVFIARAFDLLL